MSDAKANLVNIGAGWIKTSKAGSEYVSISTAGKNQKTKLFLEMPDGSFLQVRRVFATFSNKKTDKSPDLSFTVDIEKQDEQQSE